MLSGCRCPSCAWRSCRNSAAPASGGVLLDALFAELAQLFDTMCTNVHVRNPARRLYERKGFREVGQGHGPLGIAMLKDLRREND